MCWLMGNKRILNPVPGICVNISEIRIEIFIQCGKMIADVISYQLDW